jgi:prevent-host-death family protein
LLFGAGAGIRSISRNLASPMTGFAWSFNWCYYQYYQETATGGTMETTTKFSEDIVPLSDMKVNPGRVVSQVDKTRRPVLLTNRGRGVAVVQSLKDYETQTEELAFLRGVVQGLMDLEEGGEMSLSDVRNRLGLS